MEIGTNGAGNDLITTTSFLVSNAIDPILGNTFGMRLTSVGGDGEESRKMIGTYVSPNAVVKIWFELGRTFKPHLSMITGATIVATLSVIGLIALL